MLVVNCYRFHPAFLENPHYKHLFTRLLRDCGGAAQENVSEGRGEGMGGAVVGAPLRWYGGMGVRLLGGPPTWTTHILTLLRRVLGPSPVTALQFRSSPDMCA